MVGRSALGALCVVDEEPLLDPGAPKPHGDAPGDRPGSRFFRVRPIRHRCLAPQDRDEPPTEEADLNGLTTNVDSIDEGEQDPTPTLSHFAFARLLPLQQILDACKRERTQQGWRSNETVLRLLWEQGRSVQTFELGPKYLDIRKDLRIRVALPFYFVENGKACAFWLQPRKTYALDVGQLALLASMVKMAVLRDD